MRTNRSLGLAELILEVPFGETGFSSRDVTQQHDFEIVPVPARHLLHAGLVATPISDQVDAAKIIEIVETPYVTARRCFTSNRTDIWVQKVQNTLPGQTRQFEVSHF